MRLRRCFLAIVIALAGFWGTFPALLVHTPGLIQAAEPAAAAEEPAAAPEARVADEDPAAAAEASKAEADAKRARDEEYYELFKVLADTFDQVERNYVKDVSRRELMEAAIRGVVEKLDPYSNYIGREEISQFRTSVESQFGGIGIQIDVRGGMLVVVSPLVGSPAYRAGLQAGDVIVEIEGQPAEGLDIDDVIRRLKGDPGTSVTITVLSQQGQRRTVTIEREIVRIETVMGDQRDDHDQWNFMLDNERRIGYIRVTAFSRETAHDLKQAVETLRNQEMKGLVIDLRFNPGGLLTSAVEIADLFLPSGEIVSTAGRNSPKRSWEAQKDGTFEGFPMAILVNRYSASASEIVSAALQDHKRAVVVGERTWGKGSVQNVIELEDGKSALKLTTASYQRPNGHNIHRFPDSKETDEWGVKPDDGLEVRLEGPEMFELVRYRRERDILLINHSAPPSTESTEPKKDDAAAAADAPAPGTPPADDKPAEDKPAEDKPEEDKPAEVQPEAAADAPASPFVDRQLQKAIEHLTVELAKAT